MKRLSVLALAAAFCLALSLPVAHAADKKLMMATTTSTQGMESRRIMAASRFWPPSLPAGASRGMVSMPLWAALSEGSLNLPMILP